MIVIGTNKFNLEWAIANQRGLTVDVDDDRRVELWVDDKRDKWVGIHNGPFQTELLLTHEAANALLHVLLVNLLVEKGVTFAELFVDGQIVEIHTPEVTDARPPDADQS